MRAPRETLAKTAPARRAASPRPAREEITAQTPPRRSPLRQLEAEVARLEAELAAAKAEAAALAARADEDGLTGVPNRRGFERELSRTLSHIDRYGGTATLLYVDLDRFKAINDTQGHAAGDAMLVAVARALVAHVRASDTVARLGGDEFALILWHIDEANARRKADAIAAMIASLPGAGEGFGASVGLAALQPGDTPADALARADADMYAVKRARPRPA